MRLVDADAAKELWQGDNPTAVTMRKIFDALPTVQAAPQWISTKDRLPEPEESVIVRLKNGIHTDITSACYFPWASMPDPSDGLFWDHVTHWMPYPGIPEEQN